MAIFLFCLFILLPLAELYVIVQVGDAIGIWPTLAILLIDGFLGAALARSQGRAVWQRFNDQMAAGKVPAREIVDGAMIILGGALLLSPGFITDIFGILLLLPPARAIWRGILKRIAGRHPAGRPVFFFYDRIGDRSFRGGGGAPPPPRQPGGPGPRPGPTPGGAAGTPRGSRSYDVEGTAHEIGDADHVLPGETGSAADRERGSGA